MNVEEMRSDLVKRCCKISCDECVFKNEECKNGSCFIGIKNFSDEKIIKMHKFAFLEKYETTEKEIIENQIKDSGDRTQFETGAVRDLGTGKGRMDLLPFHAILELSKHCENGAMKYEEHNVEKGIPQHSLIDSGMRHLFKYAAGYTDEDHLLAAMWNIAWAVNQRTTHPELIDVPWKWENEKHN